MMPHRLLRRSLLLAVRTAGLVVAASCGSSDPTSPTVSLVGTYTLKTANGSALPYTTPNGDALVADQLTLNDDGTYVDVAQYALARGGFATTTEYGTFESNNGAIFFDDQTDGLSYQGSLSGRVLTEIVGGLTEVFQKD